MTEKQAAERLRRVQLSHLNRPLEVFLHWRSRCESESLYLDAPYQRGFVWGEKRKVNLIRSLTLGIPTGIIVINDRLKADFELEPGRGYDARMAVIDGKQRISAIIDFVDGRISVPGEFFDVAGMVRFIDLSTVQQRRFRGMPMATAEATVSTLDQEREIFELINFGGLAQGESDE